MPSLFQGLDSCLLRGHCFLVFSSLSSSGRPFVSHISGFFLQIFDGGGGPKIAIPVETMPNGEAWEKNPLTHIGNYPLYNIRAWQCCKPGNAASLVMLQHYSSTLHDQNVGIQKGSSNC